MKFIEKYKVTCAAEGVSTFAPFSKEARWTDIKPGVYNKGLITICNNSYDDSTLDAWEWLIGKNCLIVGYLAWGDFIYISFDKKEFYIMLAQEQQNLCIGDNLESVFDYNLAADNFYEKIMLPDKFHEISSVLGELSFGECYVHEPWVALGNKELISNYKKKNFVLYIEVLGQTLRQL